MLLALNMKGMHISNTIKSRLLKRSDVFNSNKIYFFLSLLLMSILKGLILSSLP